MRRFSLFAVVLLLMVATFGCKQEAPAPPAKGAQVPAFTARDLAGQELSLAQYRGKVVFLNFWATWCPPCRAELPSMERLNQVFGARDFVMLAVNVDDNGPAVLPQFLQQYPHSYTVLIDSDRKLQNLYQVFRFPETYIIGKDGKLVDHVIGARDWSDDAMLRYFAQLISGK